MKKWVLLGILALVPVLAPAQVAVDRFTLMSAFDLDGEAADADQIVAGPDVLADSTTYVIDAQPDACRLVDITVVDGDSSLVSGAITVTGKDCLGYPLVASFTFAGGGSGVKTLTVTTGSGSGAYFSSITSVITGVLDAEGGADTVTVGYTSNSVNGWAMYGRLKPPGPSGEHSVDPTAWFDVARRITTSGASSATVTGVVGAEDAFEMVAAGDLLIIQVGGTSYERKVTARASADSITVNKALNIPAAGVTFRFKKLYYSTNPDDLMLIPVNGYRTMLLDWSVDANANTGGVITLLSCTDDRVEFPLNRWVQLNTTTVASAATQGNTSESVDLSFLPYSYCRFGLRFGTGDDVDAAAEDINATVTLMR